MTDERIEAIRNKAARMLGNYGLVADQLVYDINHLLSKYDELEADKQKGWDWGHRGWAAADRLALRCESAEARLTNADAILRDVADFKVTIVAGPQGQQVCGICNGFVDEPAAASHFDGCLVRRARQYLEDQS